MKAKSEDVVNNGVVKNVKFLGKCIETENRLVMV